MMSSCAVGSGNRSRSDVPAAILASIALNVAVVAAMRTDGGGTLSAWLAGWPALASAGLASARLTSSKLPAPAISRSLATMKASLKRCSLAPQLLPVIYRHHLATLKEGLMSDKTQVVAMRERGNSLARSGSRGQAADYDCSGRHYYGSLTAWPPGGI